MAGLNEISDVYRDAEYGVLGSLLIDADMTAPLIFSSVRAEHFVHGDCRHIFQTACDMYGRGDKLDVLTIISAAGQGYRQMAMEIMDITPTAANCEEYIRILRECAVRSRLAQQAMELYKAAASGAQMADLHKLIGTITETASGTTERKSLSTKELSVDYFSRAGEKRTYLNWGYDKVNKYVYVNPGDYVVIGARPSVGKTAFALQIGTIMAKRHKVTFFSMETGKSNIADRLFAAQAEIDLGRIKRGEQTEQDMLAAIKAKENLLDMDFHYMDASGWTAEEIRAETIRSGSEIIIVDYLGLINHPNPKINENEYARVSAASRSLHLLAKSGVCVIALSQLSRDGDGMSALRGSGQIEQDADVIMMLEKVEIDKSSTPEERQDAKKRRFLKIPKNKDGRTGKVDLWFIGETQRFVQQWDGFYKAKTVAMQEDKDDTPEQVSMKGVTK